MPMPQVGGRLRNNPNGWWGFDPGFGFDDWLEAVAMYSPTQLAVARKVSTSTLTGFVPFDRLLGCIVFMLGYSWVKDANGFPVISRELPAVHPTMPALVADQLLECRGVKFISKVVGHHPRSLPYANYTLAQVTFSYRQEKYPILEDNQLDMSSLVAYRGQELKRFAYWCPRQRTEFLELPGGMLSFDAPGKSWDNANFLSPRQIYPQNKTMRRLVWMGVPESFIFNDYGFSKLDKYVGYINRFPFFADPNSAPGTDGGAHTWLFEDWEVLDNDIYADPIASMAFEGLERRVNIGMNFVHFNPPRGRPENSEAGWRLNLAADGNYYPGKYRVDVLGPGINVPQNIPYEIDFGCFFTHHTDVLL